MSAPDATQLPAALVQAVLAAAAEAAQRLPSSQQLQPGQPSTDLEDLTLLPADAAGGVSARLSGAVQGEVVLIVAQELVQALQESPLGALELAAAVQPALEAAGATLGQVVVEQGREMEPELALDGLQGLGASLLVPLVADDGQVHAAFAMAVAAQAPVPSAPVAGPMAGQDPGQTSPGSAVGQVPGQSGVPQARRAAGLELLRDVEMEVTAELGRTRMTVRELLSLAPGAVIELDRMAGSPADVLVNGTLLARGEVVVVDEDFGIRITEIVVDAGDSPQELPQPATPGAPG